MTYFEQKTAIPEPDFPGATSRIKQINGLTHRVNYRFERFRMVEGQIGENLAVKAYTMLIQCVNQPGVRNAMGARTCIDTGNPKTAESAFFGATVAIGIAHRFVQGIFGNRKDVSPGAEETTGCFEHFFASLARRDSIH